MSGGAWEDPAVRAAVARSIQEQHWTHVEHSEEGLQAGPWRRVTRAVCQCGWTSSWFFSGAVAVEEGLTHSATSRTL
jgi:hypothetical protein